MRIITGLWQWRFSPLRRRTDLAEAWVALCATALLALGAPVAGVVAGSVAHEELSTLSREQRIQRQQVWATVKQAVERPPAGPGSARPDRHPERHPALAFWKDAKGVIHTGTVYTVRQLAPGEGLHVWIDTDGELTTAPLAPRTALAHAVVAGLVVCVVTAIAVVAARRAVVNHMLRRRYARWDEEWERIGPDWGRAGSNN